MKEEIICAGCYEVFECKLEESPHQCARRHKLFCLEFEDTTKGCGESIYLCRKCFDKFVFPLFNKNKNTCISEEEEDKLIEQGLKHIKFDEWKMDEIEKISLKVRFIQFGNFIIGKLKEGERK